MFQNSTSGLPAAILTGRQDWRRWLPAIEGAAEEYWRFWDPLIQHKDKPPKSPQRPQKKTRATSSRATTRRAAANAVAAAAASEASSSATLSADGEADGTGGTNNPDGSDDLSSFDFDNYKIDLLAYKDYMRKVNEVRQLIIRTVAPHISMMLNDLSDKSLATWMAELHVLYGENKEESKLMAERAYKASLKSFRGVKLKEWTKAWEEAVAECRRLNHPCVSDGQWLSDFYGIMDPYYPGLAEKARETYNTGDSV
ncbi:hypothetical protein SEUCBS139899_008915 [Sporothrix eucalyptigena]